VEIEIRNDDVGVASIGGVEESRGGRESDHKKFLELQIRTFAPSPKCRCLWLAIFRVTRC